jgi:hypothetical protein
LSEKMIGKTAPSSTKGAAFRRQPASLPNHARMKNGRYSARLLPHALE